MLTLADEAGLAGFLLASRVRRAFLGLPAEEAQRLLADVRNTGAGDAVIFRLGHDVQHQVLPVTKGARVACFFWVQSMIRDDPARTLLFDLDQSIQALAAERGHDDREIVRLTGIYHNLLRRWADT